MMKLKPVLTVALLAAVLATPARAVEPAAGSAWVEPHTGIEFVWIPGGCFQMGSDEGESDEGPVHKVCVNGFYMGKYEVTQSQYQKMTGTNPSKFKGENNPVETVSYQQVRVLLDLYNHQTGENLRLPTEAEWEYACRAGGRHDEYCGEGGMDRLGWYGESLETGSPHPVGQKRPNQFGLYDMSGNVWEWVEDCYNVNYTSAPDDGSALRGKCHRFVLRGGSWGDFPMYTRAANRSYCVPNGKGEHDGFRLAITLP
ncbi:MAG: formylglycine-generating enzyme family protein [Nitrosomonadales bacterium]|nr:formylglycine-generating enzyme family protein [Nitrosomonadales bacterium]